MKDQHNMPAFPSHGSLGEVIQEGMSLRDYFAAGAMQTIIGHQHYTGQQMYDLTVQGGGEFSHYATKEQSIEARDRQVQLIAQQSYLMADAMLAQREREVSND